MDHKSFVNIRVSNNLGSPWVETAIGMVKGYAFLEDRLLSPQELLIYCKHAIDCFEDREERLEQLNGCFSIILNMKDRICLISDKLKTYPLFYQLVDGVYYITDTGQETLKYLPQRILQRNSLLQFLSCGYLTGGNTLFKDVKLVAPAYIVEIYKEIMYAYPYSNRVQPKVRRSKEEVIQKGAEALEHAFQRSLQLVNGRTIILPLSGGYDSRLIACLCRKYNVEKVICFSYGIEGCEEVEVSRRVAEKLGYPWHSVLCTAEKWGALVRSSAFQDYIQYGGNLNAIAHIQDFLALHELTEKGIIPPNSVFIPGHTGDVLGGSHLPRQMRIGSLLRDLYEKYFCLNILNNKAWSELNKEMYQLIWLSYGRNGQDEFCYEAFYQWGVNTRQSNFIINAVRAYEFFGHSWLLPMWDDEFEHFWSSVPYSERVGSALYTEFAFRNYFEPMGVAFRKKEANGLPSRWQRLVWRLVSRDIRYVIKLFMSQRGLYHFPKDNAGLDEAAKALKSMFTIDVPELVLQKEEIMSIKALYYLSLLNPAKAPD